jgi:hypothetical protein
MLVVPLGQIVLAGRMTLAEDGINVIQTRLAWFLADLANIDLDLAGIG